MRLLLADFTSSCRSLFPRIRDLLVLRVKGSLLVGVLQVLQSARRLVQEVVFHCQGSSTIAVEAQLDFGKRLPHVHRSRLPCCC